MFRQGKYAKMEFMVVMGLRIESIDCYSTQKETVRGNESVLKLGSAGGLKALCIHYNPLMIQLK